MRTPCRASLTVVLVLLLSQAIATGARAASDTIGGDDVLITTYEGVKKPDIAIASDGDLFVAASVRDDAAMIYDQLRIFRSQDGGDTWSEWGVVDAPASCVYAKLLIVPGMQERIYVAYVRWMFRDVRIAWANTNSATPTFTYSTAMDLAGEDFMKIDLATDAESYSSYALYLIAISEDDPGWDVWFTRSSDAGATWETPYAIGLLGHGEGSYYAPRLSYGFGGYVHAVWEHLQSAPADDATLYRRADRRASGGIVTWDPIVELTSDANGIDERWPAVVASPTSDEVLIFHSRHPESESHVLISEDAGATWPKDSYAPIPRGFDFDALRIPGLGRSGWVAGYAESYSSHFGLIRAPRNDPFDWSEYEAFDDRSYDDNVAEGNPIALDPTRNYRAAMVWTKWESGPGVPDSLFFDAEWRGDPGYPNLEDGFPVTLETQPVVPPALVDLTNDGHLEIVFGDEDGHLLVYDSAGEIVTGWPSDVGTFPDNGSIAIGDLNGDGENTVVAGNDSGMIYAYGPDGELQPGWPVDLGTGTDMHVAIGILGPPYLRYVVATSDVYMWVLDYAGRIVTPYPVQFGSAAVGPAAIGDVDNDGVNEIVTLKSEWYHVHELGEISSEQYRRFEGESFRGQPSLADLDLDGDLEIAIATTHGFVYVLHHTNSLYSGWPFDHGGNYKINNVAIADVLGDARPELAFTASNYTLHLLTDDGVECPSYPCGTGLGGWLWGAPVLDDVNASTPSVTVAALDGQAWSWESDGNLVAGWPKDLDTQFELTPASGDIDDDGINEMVFVGNSALVAVDLAIPPQVLAAKRWPMSGYDPQRTGCAACSDPVLTSVDGSARLTRVHFRAPYPNPMTSTVQLAVDVPHRAAVELAVYDVRGRRVRSLFKSEAGPGELAFTWNGRDDRGAELASGAYFARLRVRGNGFDETMTRKVLLVR